MKVVEGTFGKTQEQGRPSPEEILAILVEELDLSKHTDIVVIVGEEDSFSFLTNMGLADANLMIDKTKLTLTSVE